ncbi:hypothetical protein TNCT6_56580 [Streptomyces sp. 6-11-2]|nr:hypothetical protein TNCT6_56580 [Streptomyces sp. 6-11-2]
MLTVQTASTVADPTGAGGTAVQTSPSGTEISTGRNRPSFHGIRSPGWESPHRDAVGEAGA